MRTRASQARLMAALSTVLRYRLDTSTAHVIPQPAGGYSLSFPDALAQAGETNKVATTGSVLTATRDTNRDWQFTLQRPDTTTVTFPAAAVDAVGHLDQIEVAVANLEGLAGEWVIASHDDNDDPDASMVVCSPARTINWFDPVAPVIAVPGSYLAGLPAPDWMPGAGTMRDLVYTLIAHRRAVERELVRQDRRKAGAGWATVALTDGDRMVGVVAMADMVAGATATLSEAGQVIMRTLDVAVFAFDEYHLTYLVRHNGQPVARWVCAIEHEDTAALLADLTGTAPFLSTTTTMFADCPEVKTTGAGRFIRKPDLAGGAVYPRDLHQAGRVSAG